MSLVTTHFDYFQTLVGRVVDEAEWAQARAAIGVTNDGRKDAEVSVWVLGNLITQLGKAKQRYEGIARHALPIAPPPSKDATDDG